MNDTNIFTAYTMNYIINIYPDTNKLMTIIVDEKYKNVNLKYCKELEDCVRTKIKSNESLLLDIDNTDSNYRINFNFILEVSDVLINEYQGDLEEYKNTYEVFKNIYDGVVNHNDSHLISTCNKLYELYIKSYKDISIVFIGNTNKILSNFLSIYSKDELIKYIIKYNKSNRNIKNVDINLFTNSLTENVLTLCKLYNKNKTYVGLLQHTVKFYASYLIDMVDIVDEKILTNPIVISILEQNTRYLRKRIVNPTLTQKLIIDTIDGKYDDVLPKVQKVTNDDIIDVPIKFTDIESLTDMNSKKLFKYYYKVCKGVDLNYTSDNNISNLLSFETKYYDKLFISTIVDGKLLRGDAYELHIAGFNKPINGNRLITDVNIITKLNLLNVKYYIERIKLGDTINIFTKDFEEYRLENVTYWSRKLEHMELTDNMLCLCEGKLFKYKYLKLAKEILSM